MRGNVPVSVARRRRTGKAGLTLIELLFAVSILAFVTLGVAGMFPAALAHNGLVAGMRFLKLLLVQALLS